MGHQAAGGLKGIFVIGMLSDLRDDLNISDYVTGVYDEDRNPENKTGDRPLMESDLRLF